jgi:hypothetical protein
MFSCKEQSSTFEIKDLSKKQEITLTPNSKMDVVNGLEIIIKGKVNGSFLVEQTNGYNVTYKYEFEKGNIDKCISGDWYSSDCIIIYEPLGKVEGKLAITYKFY